MQGFNYSRNDISENNVVSILVSYTPYVIRNTGQNGNTVIQDFSTIYVLICTSRPV